jgi:hypothetical protein
MFTGFGKSTPAGISGEPATRGVSIDEQLYRIDALTYTSSPLPHAPNQLDHGLTGSVSVVGLFQVFFTYTIDMELSCLLERCKAPQY